MAAQRGLDVAGVEQRRERVAQPQADGGAALGHPARRLHPAPRGLVARSQPPARGHVAVGAPRLGQHLLGDQQAQLDPHAREADALAAGLGAGGHVVVARQLAPRHAGAVVAHHQGPLGGLDQQADARGARVERVGDDLGEDRLLERAGIGVAQVLEQVLQVDPGLAHTSCLILRGTSAAGRRRFAAERQQATTESRAAPGRAARTPARRGEAPGRDRAGPRSGP